MSEPTSLLDRRTAPVTALADSAFRIVQEARRVDIRRAEDDASGQARMELVVALRASLDQAANLLGDVERAYSNGAPNEGEATTPEQQLADLAAMAATSIESKRRLLRPIEPGTEHWDAIDRCDRALRAIERSLTAVEQALAEYAGIPPRIVVEDELQKGILLRRLYAKFHDAIHESVTATDKVLAQRIRSAGTALAMLTGRAEYPLMRVSDRILVRKLQRRVIEWSSAGGADAGAGAHLLSELLSVSELLMEINRRAELVEYDHNQQAHGPTQQTNGSAAIAAAGHNPSTATKGE
jgi:hypothetical protein